MRYLFGDSTESNLDINYLAFLREVVDCAVVLVQCDVTLAELAERQRTRERETETALAAVAEFGKRAKDFVAPVADEKAGTAVGRCAAAIAAAVRDAVESESTDAKAKLTTERDELTRESAVVTKRAKEAFEKLLRTHDLPSAAREIEVVWNAAGGVKATMRQKTEFGVEAVLALDLPAGSILYTPDLRVERVSDAVEVHAREAGGWLKKGEKLVPHKLGRYHVASIAIGANTKIQLRADGSAGELLIISQPNGDMTVAATGGNTAREIVIEDRDRSHLRAFVDKLEGAARALAEARGSVVAIEVDGKSMAEARNPRAVAERLTSAIGPTVQQIKKHSRSPDELVLRRLLGDNRREEIFVPISELVQRVEVLPAHVRGVFAPLHLKDDWRSSPAPAPAPAAKVEVKVDAKSGEAKWDPKPDSKYDPKAPTVDMKVYDTKADMRSSDGKPEEPRRANRITSSPVPMPAKPATAVIPEAVPTPVRAKEPTQPGAAPIDVKRPQSTSTSPLPSLGTPASPPAPALANAPMSSSPSIPSPPVVPGGKTVDEDDEDEWPSIAKSDSSDTPPSVTTKS